MGVTSLANWNVSGVCKQQGYAIAAEPCRRRSGSVRRRNRSSSTEPHQENGHGRPSLMCLTVRELDRLSRNMVKQLIVEERAQARWGHD